MPLTQAQTQDAYRFFALVFNAAPGVTYMNQIADAYMAGATTQQIVNTYTTKPQFQSVYPNFLSNQAFATNLVNNVVGNTATQAAKDQAVADIVAALNGGSTRGDVIYTVFTNLANKSFTDPEWGNTAKMFANKVAVAQYVTETKLFDSTNLSTLQSFLANVAPSTDTSTPAAIEAALQGSALNQGQTFTLTPGADLAGTTSASNSGIASDFRFTSGNEKIEAGPGTLQATDVFLDASTTDNDVLNATLTGLSGTFTAQNIETINVNFVNAAADLQLDNVSGTKAVTVSGATAGRVSGLNAQAATPTVGVNGYTNTLTVQAQTFAGTVATNNAETLNLSVAGASWGTTAATQTAIVVDSVAGGSLETLNITSTGTTANAFSLAAGAGDAFATINVGGTADATIRMTNANVSGVTINATGNTGVTTLSVDRAGVAAASTNLTNVSGVEKVEFRDANNAASLVATNVAAGVEVSAVNSFAAGSSISVFGAATNPADELKLTLDHATANTATVIGGLDVQSVETLHLVSNGNSAATVAAGNGNSLTLTGDFTAINVTGDTTLILDYTIDGAASGTVNAVVNASGLTGTAGANITVTAGAGAGTNTFTVIGTANADTIVGGAEGNTLNGGAGNDTITGGALVDTINAGDGNDRIVSTAGADVITTGSGVDTIAFGSGALDDDKVAIQIADFTTGTSTTDRDVLEIENGNDYGSVTNLVSTLAATYVEGTVGVIGTNDSATPFANNTIMVITDQAFANFAAVQAELATEAGAALTSYAVVFLNSTTGFAELWVDDTTANTTNDVQLATFQNITTLVGVAGFDAANFTVV